MKVVRNRKPVTLKVTVAARPNMNARREKASPRNYSGQKAPFDLGFSVGDLTPELRNEYQLAPNVRSPMILEVERGSLASLAGLRVGDLIVDVNKKEVTRALDVSKFLKKGSNTLRLVRGGNLMIVTIDTK